MKKVLTFLLLFVAAFGMVSCGDDGGEEGKTPINPNPPVNPNPTGYEAYESLCKGKTVYVTEAGQGGESATVAQLVKRAGGNPTTNTSLKASDVASGSVVFLVVGASNKGLTNGGTSKEKEIARANEFSSKASDGSITLVVLHIGGSARRGTLSDGMIEAALSGANLALVVNSGNTDGFFTNNCANLDVPLLTFDASSGMLELFKAFYK